MNRLHVTLAASLLALATPALAAPPAAQPAPRAAPVETAPVAAGPKIGIGIALGSGGDFANTTEILVPIILNPMIRVEPSIGIATRGGPGDASARDLVLGVGVFAAKRVAPTTELLFGGRLKLDFAHRDSGLPGDSGDSGTNVILAGAAGAEHWFSDKFSLGLEAQLGYYSLSNVSGDYSGLYTAGALTARVYF